MSKPNKLVILLYSPDHLRWWEVIFAGGIAGMTAWTIILPMDVIKSRAQVLKAISTSQSNANVLIAKDILKTSGVRGLYAGWTAVMLRAFPTNGALFAGYEICHRFLSER
jgi:solute carrier family 25 carnitine/acylcarnitine transporter 20/29